MNTYNTCKAIIIVIISIIIIAGPLSAKLAKKKLCREELNQVQQELTQVTQELVDCSQKLGQCQQENTIYRRMAGFLIAQKTNTSSEAQSIPHPEEPEPGDNVVGDDEDDDGGDAGDTD